MDLYSIWPGGPQIANADGVYAVGTDSVLLSRFIGRSSGLGADLGCGCGLLGISLLWQFPQLRMLFVDVQEAAMAATRENLERNGLLDRARLCCQDLRHFCCPEERDRYDLIVANPPYYPVSSGLTSPDPARALARTELGCTLAELTETTSQMLRTGGRFCLVHKPQRMAELLYCMHDFGLEPKRLRMVQAQKDKAPSLVLAEGKKGAKPGLIVEPPMILEEKETIYP